MKKSTEQLYRERILKVLVFIQKNLDSELSLDEFARVAHTGPYDTVGQTYAKLFGQWLPHSGRELRSEPGLEFYLNDPESTDPEDLLTDIYAPLEPMK